jgi:hypothetical protein
MMNRWFINVSNTSLQVASLNQSMWTVIVYHVEAAKSHCYHHIWPVRMIDTCYHCYILPFNHRLKKYNYILMWIYYQFVEGNHVVYVPIFGKCTPQGLLEIYGLQTVATLQDRSVYDR